MPRPPNPEGITAALIIAGVLALWVMGTIVVMVGYWLVTGAAPVVS
jgi:hypothetical protein